MKIWPILRRKLKKYINLVWFEKVLGRRFYQIFILLLLCLLLGLLWVLVVIVFVVSIPVLVHQYMYLNDVEVNWFIM